MQMLKSISKGYILYDFIYITFLNKNYRNEEHISSCWRPRSRKEKEVARIINGNRDFPGGAVVKILPCNARDFSSIPGQGTKIPSAWELIALKDPSWHN